MFDCYRVQIGCDRFNVKCANLYAGQAAFKKLNGLKKTIEGRLKKDVDKYNQFASYGSASNAPTKVSLTEVLSKESELFNEVQYAGPTVGERKVIHELHMQERSQEEKMHVVMEEPTSSNSIPNITHAF